MQWETFLEARCRHAGIELRWPRSGLNVGVSEIQAHLGEEQLIIAQVHDGVLPALPQLLCNLAILQVQTSGWSLQPYPGRGNRVKPLGCLPQPLRNLGILQGWQQQAQGSSHILAKTTESKPFISDAFPKLHVHMHVHPFSHRMLPQ